ncbi:MAG: tail fiber domain-containing protein [Flavobacteriales bacterium]|nr:tail fiber domain-containing protein [Flavobacteriales bacterium]
MTKVLVVDDSFTPEYGVIKYRDISTMQDCDWEITASDDVVTAWQTGPINGCPDEANMVGIGTDVPEAKLDVLKTRNTGLAEDIAIRAQNDVVGGTKVAADLINVQEGDANYGLRSAVDGAYRNWGVSSLTGAGVLNGSVVSGYFFADGEYITQDPIAVWGTAVRDMSGGPGWAAWFDGYGYLSLGPWVTSDATLKQNIEPLGGCLDVVEQLAPKSYEFAAQDHPEMNLPTGYQAGVLAQDLQQVLPHLVREAHRPEVTDSAGNVISSSADLLTVNYEGIIPYLIGAVQELKSANDAQQAQISALQQDLASCCAANGDADLRSMGSGAGAGAGAGEALRTDLFILPNPVADHTQLRYTVATPGRTRLEVSDASGKRLEVLEEAVREVGTYTHDWTTTDLAPGTYHCTLYLNDSFVVKKAVKVAR